MALIDCPFCGRSGVSDQALWCPGCSRNVKEYFYQQNKEAREAAIRESVAAAFQKELERKSVFQTFRETGKSGWIVIACLLLMIFTALCFAYSFGTAAGYIIFGLIILAELIGLGYTLRDMIKNRYQKHLAKKDMARYLKEELEKRQQQAVAKENETHLPYQAEHILTEHICPHCGKDCDRLKHVCKECGAGLALEPIPNPAANGDISYMWCPKCGYRYLRTKFTDSPVSSHSHYKRWCPNCGYVLESKIFRQT